MRWPAITNGFRDFTRVCPYSRHVLQLMYRLLAYAATALPLVFGGLRLQAPPLRGMTVGQEAAQLAALAKAQQNVAGLDVIIALRIRNQLLLTPDAHHIDIALRQG